MQIYYFTRTERSQRIAEELAARYGTQAERIDDHKNWQGKVRYMQAGFYALRGNALPADYKQPNPEEQIALVFPIWAGSFPPAVRSFVQEVGRAHIIAIPTSLGSTLKDREGFVKVIDLVGKEIVAPEDL